MTAPTVTTYVRSLTPGTFFPEDRSGPVPSRDPLAVARAAEPEVFAFEFYDVVSTTVTVGGREVELRSKPLNRSGRYYIDAEELSAGDVEALPGDHSILLANMRSNGWDTVLRCRPGNFQPLESGDKVISTEAAAS